MDHVTPSIPPEQPHTGDIHNEAQQSYLTSNICDESEMREMIWTNKIPVRVDLSELSNAREQQALPKFMFFHRIHHPIFYFESIHEHFAQYSPVPRSDMHLFLTIRDENQVDHLVQWGIPFGVTFDLIFGNTETLPSATISLPSSIIQLTAHYGPPTSICLDDSENSNKSSTSEIATPLLVPIDEKGGNNVSEAAKSSFKFQLKEALLIRQKNIFVLTQVSLLDQERFYQAFVDLNESAFFPILRAIFFDNQHSHSAPSSPEFVPIRVPIRLYIAKYPGRIQIAEIIASEEQTIGSTLARFLPNIIKETDSSFEIANKYAKLALFINGIRMQLDTPLLFLNNHFLHFDGFVYLVLQY